MMPEVDPCDGAIQLSLFGLRPAPPLPPALLDARPANDVRPDLRRIAEGARAVVCAVDAVIAEKARQPWR